MGQRQQRRHQDIASLSISRLRDVAERLQGTSGAQLLHPSLAPSARPSGLCPHPRLSYKITDKRACHAHPTRSKTSILFPNPRCHNAPSPRPHAPNHAALPHDHPSTHTNAQQSCRHYVPVRLHGSCAHANGTNKSMVNACALNLTRTIIS